MIRAEPSPIGRDTRSAVATILLGLLEPEVDEGHAGRTCFRVQLNPAVLDLLLGQVEDAVEWDARSAPIRPTTPDSIKANSKYNPRRM